MTAALLIGLVLAGASDIRVDADARGQAQAIGIGGTFAIDRFSVTLAGARSTQYPLADPDGWAYGIYGTVSHRLGPVQVGLRIGGGTQWDASFFGRYKLGPTFWTADVGYRRTLVPFAPDARSPLVLGNSLQASLRISAPLGAVTVYAMARFANGLGGFSLPSPTAAPLPTPPPASDEDCPPTMTTEPTPPTVLDPAARVQPRLLVPGFGLSAPVFEWARLYADVEYFAGRGFQFFAGVTFTIERHRPAPGVVPEPDPAKPEPVKSKVLVQLTGNGSPISGTAVAAGPTASIPITLAADGKGNVELAPGRWRVRFRSPGFLGREVGVTVGEAKDFTLNADLLPVPERRSVMLTPGGVRLFRTVEFAGNGTDLTDASKALLAEVADLAVEEPARLVTITAHVDRDDGGDAESLSQTQADAIVAYLGTLLAPERLTGLGAGAKHPLIPNLLNVARKMNRRVIIELK